MVFPGTVVTSKGRFLQQVSNSLQKQEKDVFANRVTFFMNQIMSTTVLMF